MAKKAALIVLGVVIVFLLATIALAGKEGLPDNRGKEVVEARTAYSKMFRNPDQKTTTITFSNIPLHYQDTKGKWQDVDTNPENVTGETDEDGNAYAYRVAKNVFSTYFPKSSRGWVELRSGKSRLAFKLVTGTERLLTKHKEGCKAEAIFGNCDVNYTVRAGLFKEDIILKNRSTPKSFEYLIRLHNLQLTQNDSGEYVFSDTNHRNVFQMSKFVMYDAQGAVSEDIQVQLTQTGNMYRLQVTPGQSWLDDPQRVYPVTIDPTYYAISLTRKEHSKFFMYIPCNYPATSNPGTFGPGYINNFGNLVIKSYRVHSWCTFTVGTNGTGSIHQYPYFTVKQCQPDGMVFGDPVLTLTNFHEATRAGEFDINANEGCLIEVESGHYSTLLGGSNGFPCSFTITYQDESTSPPPPTLSLLPPETYGTSVTLTWSVPQDQTNDPSGKASGINGYFVQYSTDSNFATANTPLSVGNVSSYTVSGLTANTIYYFRVYAQDVDRNPLNLNLYDLQTNPTGVRWSIITRTKCVSAPLPGGPDQPRIEGVTQLP